jgi:hypothetical protein
VAPGAINHRPAGAASSRAAVAALLRALERGDRSGMRRVMTPDAQRDENVHGGLLSAMPKLTSFRFRGVAREDPGDNASPSGSIASLRYTVAMTPSSGFDDDDTSGTAYEILTSETRGKRWLIAEVGGCC